MVRLIGSNHSFKAWREKEPVSEQPCEACSGTGFAPVKASPDDPMRRVYPARCAKCGGKGRLPSRD